MSLAHQSRRPLAGHQGGAPPGGEKRVAGEPALPDCLVDALARHAGGGNQTKNELGLGMYLFSHDQTNKVQTKQVNGYVCTGSCISSQMPALTKRYRIRLALAHNGMDQKDLQTKVGAKKANLSNAISSGVTQLDKEIARVLGVTVAWLHGEGDPPPWYRPDSKPETPLSPEEISKLRKLLQGSAPAESDAEAAEMDEMDHVTDRDPSGRHL